MPSPPLSSETRLLVVGSDHAGLQLKDRLKQHAERLGLRVEDVGTQSGDSVDYPDYGAKVGRRVVELAAEGALGLAVCGSGIGISIAANKVRGVRAALCHDVTSARLSREHNDANVLCLGERLIGVAVAEACLETFLSTEFAGGRHARRVEKLSGLDGDRG